MTPKQIQRKYATIEKHMDRLEEELSQLQLICSHSNASKTYRGDTGNYDKTADSYWIEYKCSDCRKFWTVPQ